MKKFCFLGLFVTALSISACQKSDKSQGGVDVRMIKGAWAVMSIDDGNSLKARADHEGYLEGDGRKAKILFVFGDSEISMGILEQGQAAQWSKGKYKLDGKKIIGSNSRDLTITDMGRQSLKLNEAGVDMELMRTAMPDFGDQTDAAPKDKVLPRPSRRNL